MNLTQAISYFLNSGLLQSFCQLPCAINSAITLASFAVSFCSGLLAVSFPFSLYIYFFMSALFVVQNLPPVYALKFYGLGYKLALHWYRYSDKWPPINQGSSHGSHGCVEKKISFSSIYIYWLWIDREWNKLILFTAISEDNYFASQDFELDFQLDVESNVKTYEYLVEFKRDSVEDQRLNQFGSGRGAEKTIYKIARVCRLFAADFYLCINYWNIFSIRERLFVFLNNGKGGFFLHSSQREKSKAGKMSSFNPSSRLALRSRSRRINEL